MSQYNSSWNLEACYLGAIWKMETEHDEDARTLEVRNHQAAIIGRGGRGDRGALRATSGRRGWAALEATVSVVAAAATQAVTAAQAQHPRKRGHCSALCSAAPPRFSRPLHIPLLAITPPPSRCPSLQAPIWPPRSSQAPREPHRHSFPTKSPPVPSYTASPPQATNFVPPST